MAGESTGRINGARLTMDAQWSPDSQWVAYRFKGDGAIQLWRSSRNGHVQEQLTQNAANVVNFKWSTDGSKLFYEVGRSRNATRKALREESERGYRFDDRFFVANSTAPLYADAESADAFAPEHIAGLWVYDFQIKEERPASSEDKHAYDALVTDVSTTPGNRGVREVVAYHDPPAVAWLENEDPTKYTGFRPPLRLHAITLSGDEVRCSANQCVGWLQAPTWDVSGEEVFFTRREGINGLRTGVYAWRPETDALRTVLQTDDLIEDCQAIINQLVCLHESPTTPRKIVAINTADGSVDTIYDPNPAFAELTLSRVEKLEWQAGLGAYAAGHLVYPLGYVSGQRYPLVIVQYRSRGFLRGGVGEEYAIHPLAANDFFVLSFDRPEKTAANQTISDPYERERADWGEDLWERESALSALEIMVDRLDKRGLIDRERVGITGLSDGVETLWYAMIHSDYFAVASASSGGWSPSWYYLLNATGRENYLKRGAELWPPGTGGDERWRRISPEFHADRIEIPILVQVADTELVVSAATIGALMDAGRPIETFVFPNEYHVKWQPKHKLAVYERGIDWFNFWLRGVQDTNPSKSLQYQRWHQLKKRVDGEGL